MEPRVNNTHSSVAMNMASEFLAERYGLGQSAESRSQLWLSLAIVFAYRLGFFREGGAANVGHCPRQHCSLGSSSLTPRKSGI